MKEVLISIQPKWCEKIARGEKTIEVRKSRPKWETPFKVYIYATWNGSKKEILVKQDGQLFCEDWRKASGLQRASGKVIGEFVCDRIDEYKYRLTTYEETPYKGKHISKGELAKTCLSIGEINDYLNGKNGCFWHISDLKIYDKPKELSEFEKPCPYTDGSYCLERKCEHYDDYSGKCCNRVERPPQSWCCVEELQNG